MNLDKKTFKLLVEFLSEFLVEMLTGFDDNDPKKIAGALDKLNDVFSRMPEVKKEYQLLKKTKRKVIKEEQTDKTPTYPGETF